MPLSEASAIPLLEFFLFEPEDEQETLYLVALDRIFNLSIKSILLTLSYT
jgi:hypothetical protein